MNRSQLRWLLVVAGVVIWAFIVYAAYYVVHKPMTVANLKALANGAGDLLTWLAMLAMATALGSRLTRHLSYHSLLERLTFSAGLGLILISLLTLGLGLTGLLYRWILWALLAGGGLLLWREFRDLGRALRQVAWPRPRGTWHIFLTLFIGATLLLSLLVALAPPIEWDSLTYHLVGPDRYLQAHRLTYQFDIYYLLFPSFTEMLFTAGMALKGEGVARLLHLSYLVLTLGVLMAFAARYWERRLGLVAAALFLSIPTAIQIAAWSYVDLTLTFYSFASVYVLFNWLEAQVAPTDQQQSGTSGSGWLVLAGLFGGASSSIKYTGASTLLALGVILVWTLIRRRLGFKRFLISTAVVLGLALVVAAPWYIKNALVAGNPIYPLIWGGQEWNEVSTRWLLTLGEHKSIVDLLLVPWTLTVMGKEGTVAYDATYSPLFLLLLPLLLIVRREGRGIAELLLAAAVGYIAWIASGAASYGKFVLQGRMVLPIFAPLSLLCAYVLDGLRIWDRKGFSVQRLLTMVVALTLVFALLNQTLLVVALDPLPTLAGLQSREDYQDEYTTQHWHQARTYINEHLTFADKVLFLWEPRSYGYRVPHEPDPLFDNFSQLLARYGSAEGVAEGLRREGISHLLVNQYIYPWIVADYPLTPEEKATWEEFQARTLSKSAIVYADGEYLVLYQLPAGEEP